uniref:hypothetical protein n=1 Tax=Enterocloster clostridioformis TaxID=1531 RepID=UPI00243056A6|nr:hypothetical protein [Enterocloster clostridioformis]
MCGRAHYSGTRIELLGFFGLQAGSPSASAFNQQRAKLRPEALEAVFHRFNSALQADAGPGFRFLAADGSTFTFFIRLSFASPEYFVSEGHSAKGFYSMHLNALYDIQKHTYPAALIQPVHYKDEFRAFCDMVDRLHTPPGTRDVFIGDRGYCSYNNMAHVMTEALVNLTVIKHGQTKHVYKVNFSMAAHICRAFLRLATEEDPIDVMSLLRKELIPIRKERQYPRLQTAYFRKPRYFIYRAA